MLLVDIFLFQVIISNENGLNIGDESDDNNDDNDDNDSDSITDAEDEDNDIENEQATAKPRLPLNVCIYVL